MTLTSGFGACYVSLCFNFVLWSHRVLTLPSEVNPIITLLMTHVLPVTAFPRLHAPAPFRGGARFSVPPRPRGVWAASALAMLSLAPSLSFLSSSRPLLSRFPLPSMSYLYHPGTSNSLTKVFTHLYLFFLCSYFLIPANPLKERVYSLHHIQVVYFFPFAQNSYL